MNVSEKNPFAFEESYKQSADTKVALDNYVAACYSLIPDFTYNERITTLQFFYTALELEVPTNLEVGEHKDPALLAVAPIVDARIPFLDHVGLLHRLARAMEAGNPDTMQFPIMRVRRELELLKEAQNQDGDRDKIARIDSLLSRLPEIGTLDQLARKTGLVAKNIASILKRA